MSIVPEIVAESDYLIVREDSSIDIKGLHNCTNLTERDYQLVEDLYANKIPGVIKEVKGEIPVIFLRERDRPPPPPPRKKNVWDAVESVFDFGPTGNLVEFIIICIMGVTVVAFLGLMVYYLFLD